MRKREQLEEFGTNLQSSNQKTTDHYETNTSYSTLNLQEKKPQNTHDYSNYQILIDNLLEAIIIIDADGIIQYCNQTCLHLFDYQSPSDLIHLPISSLITEEYLPTFQQDQKEVHLGRGSFFTPYKAQKKDGTLIWIDGLSSLITYQKQTASILFIRDVTAQQKTSMELKKLEKKYRTIAELSANGIITLDPLGTIKYANKSFTHMIQKQEKQIIQTPFREFLDKEEIYLFQQLLLSVRKNKETIDTVELNFSIPSIGVIPVEISIAPVFEKNTFTGYICTVQNIKERKKFEEEIKKSERLKTEFMNIAAHELKSPVTPIKGYLELIISDQEANDKIKKWAGISLRNAKRILYLVDDILDVARLDNDSMKFEMRKIDIQSLFHEIIEDMTPYIREKQLQFNYEIPNELPEILGDYHRLSQVLRNLFTNAIKFTDKGSITAQAYRKDDLILFELTDTGIGMRKDETNHIFNKFYQAETSDARKHEGTGLGLFICKEIMKKHHGTITVESTHGKGSTFTLALPILQ